MQVSKRRYKFHLDRRTYYWTVLHLVTFAVLGVALYMLYEGGFVSAWFASFVVAIMLLMSLSIPRSVELDDERLTINCLLDVTEIDIEDIADIRKASPRKIGRVLPIFGGNGFFGYYGHFFDFSAFQRIVIYASEWQYLVEIVDVYEDHYYISCRRRDELISQVRTRMVQRD